MNNAKNEIKNTLEGTNSRITEAEDGISEVEDRMVEINETEQKKRLRVLGLNEKGAALLHDAHPALPVITKPADGRGEIFELEARSCGIYALAFPEASQRRVDMDYKATPFVLK